MSDNAIYEMPGTEECEHGIRKIGDEESCAMCESENQTKLIREAEKKEEKEDEI